MHELCCDYSVSCFANNDVVYFFKKICLNSLTKYLPKLVRFKS